MARKETQYRNSPRAYLGQLLTWDESSTAGRNARALRLLKGTEAIRVAQEAGVTASALSRFERGERRMRRGDVTLLARALGVTPGYLEETDRDCPNCHGTVPAMMRCLVCGSTGVATRETGELP